MNKLALLATTAIAALTFASTAEAATKIQWWHAMGGELGAKLEEIAANFNKTQSDYEIVPVYKGSYDEALTGAIAAFRANEQPAIIQVYEVGTGTMMGAKGAVYPVYQLMKDMGEPFDQSKFLPAVVGYYSDTEGNVLSLPFNSSTPIMYYNKDVFKKAGLDPEVAPKTWKEVEEFSQKIIDSGAAKCGFTTGWIAWVQLENLNAIHDQPYSTKANGFGGLDAEFTFNNDLSVRHWENLKKWQDSHVFEFGGPGGGDNAPPLFYSQECAIYMNSSASRAGVINNAKDFEVGFAPLPYYDDVTTDPKNSIIGGATLWTLQGRPAEEYKGVAKFFTYLQQPEVQAAWHQYTGYLPITQAAYDLGISQGFYEKNPGSDIAIKQLTRVTPTENSKGIRFGNYVQIRNIISDEAVAMLGGQKTAKEALDEAVAKGNQLLREFEAANQ
ncbi:ABC transporter substrate-binding protein [Youhaiella tibetensis]|uniref:sn-glycerol-3-phosphate-binding periplasmic protein UgpB n=1 Tax=Paradevosia tibetensis TaxID=1447062 RepID=A0A5B9DKR9_9HYPH|nr:sn-glycerol-3-phosphate ABC transporter substrate-binding protein UgpB [Youhaiella tibetensis]AKR54684.1 glycerol-3-phosphate ABC transportersubstrate-binding protein [Devosia sp. H5989]QEE19804.1 sn-glycerol-3-phosphate ABC transporter substrate-binding protein UgpB [Youhaiella tibetensis]GGF29819.1 ABC transporter substrate-binding protein [Youhaiella tibetensis]